MKVGKCPRDRIRGPRSLEKPGKGTIKGPLTLSYQSGPIPEGVKNITSIEFSGARPSSYPLHAMYLSSCMVIRNVPYILIQWVTDGAAPTIKFFF